MKPRLRKAILILTAVLLVLPGTEAVARSKKKKKHSQPRMNGVEALIRAEQSGGSVELVDPKNSKKKITVDFSKKETGKKEEKVEKVKKEEEKKQEEPAELEAAAPAPSGASDIHEEVRKLVEEVRGQKQGVVKAEKVTRGRSPSVGNDRPPAKQMGSDEGRAVSPLIVIDPGHGGKDPGAISKAKVREKEIVLQISKRLAQALQKRLGAKVSFTRSDDRFITLGDRNRIANRKSCDLFLSVHANASTNPKAEGIEIYYLNKASDEAAQRLAARENVGSPKLEKDMEAIVSDLLQTASTEESAIIAEGVRRSLVSRIQKKYKVEDIQVKTALFYVLVGAKCPSLLIEAGFVTNPAEGKRLKLAAYQKDLADAIAGAVARYLEKVGESEGDL